MGKRKMRICADEVAEREGARGVFGGEKGQERDDLGRNNAHRCMKKVAEK